MTTVIERLRASKQEYLEETKSRGRAAGRSWAENRAKYPELRRVADIDGDLWTDASALLKNAVDPDHEMSWGEFCEYLFEFKLVNDMPEEYFDALIEGAQELFGEIE